MPSPAYPHHHAVQFYGEEKNLYETVSSFLGQGFLDTQPALIIATGRHTVGILDQLQHRMIDIRRAQRLGDLVVFDAERLLETIAPTDVPDCVRIEENIERVMSTFAERHGRFTSVRVYGEMVDLCWKQGRYDTALRIEVFWNELSKRHRMSTLCGYAMRNFLNETMLFDEVCRQHTHVIPAHLAH
jgi:hypothetical protein